MKYVAILNTELAVCRFSRQTPANTTNPTWDPTKLHVYRCFDEQLKPTRCKPLLDIV